MAIITPTITLTSTNTLTDPLSVTTTGDLTVTNPAEFSRKVIATGSAQAVIASNSAFSYVYFKLVSSTNSASFVQVKFGGNHILKLRVGEFAFMPIYNSLAVTAEAYTAACVLEYGSFSIA